MPQYVFNARRPSERYHKSDLGFLVATILLWGMGLFTIFVCSQSYATRFFDGNAFHFVERQLICSGVGLVLFFVLFFLDMETIKKLVPFLVLLTLILCLLTFIKPLSVEKNGARRWIKLPAKFTFQPSELVKFTIVLYLAEYFSHQAEIPDIKDRNYLRSVLVFGLMVVLVLSQKDFSTSLFIMIIGILLYIVSGAKIKWLIPFFLIAIPVAILVVVTEKYRLERILGFLKPEEGAQTFNYQANAAKETIANGGLFGQGIGRGLSKLNSIPEVQADYIFAGWCEAMGYFGVIVYFIMLGFFAWRGYRTAFKCPDRFAAIASFGCVSVITLQSLLNSMVVAGVLPSTGIPLPFFSVGGSSIIVTLAMCGFILNASRCEEPVKDNGGYEDVNIDTITILQKN